MADLTPEQADLVERVRARMPTPTPAVIRRRVAEELERRPGATDAELAAAVGCSEKTAWKNRKALGLPANRRGRRRIGGGW